MPILPRFEKTSLGIYVHIPFCRSKCHYCDFYSIPGEDRPLMDRYLKAICTHIKESGNLAPGYRVDTVYFGGGTPTHFGAEGLAAILTAIRQSFDVSPRAEITFEANPDSVTPRLLRKLKSEGFNRVSLGIQTDNDALLKSLGRPHSFEDAKLAVQQIRRAGFQNLSVDLMFGLPNQSLQEWLDTLQNVLRLQPDHISCYGLKVEKGTPLYDIKDQCGLPDDEAQADMYLAMVEHLRLKGYRQYEISNFAKRGMASRHNLKYWQGGEYLGFGANASSDFDGKRFIMTRQIHDYIDGVLNHGQVIFDLQEIPLRDRAGEYLITRLRTHHGISREEYERQYLLPFDPIEEQLEKNRAVHLAILSDGRWRLSPEGYLLSNTIISDLLLAQDRSIPASKRR